MFNLSEKKDGRVYEMRQITETTTSWNLHLRRNMHVWEEEQYNPLQGTLAQINNEEGDDSWSWTKDSRGIFTVKSMYELISTPQKISPSPHHPFPYTLVWKKPVPLNIKMFLWTLVLGRTQTVDNLNRKGQNLVAVCVMCGMLEESILHLFLHYPKSLEIWAFFLGFNSDLYASIFETGSVTEWLLAWPKKRGNDLSLIVWQLLPVAIIWIIWKFRNGRTFSGKEITTGKMVMEIEGIIWYWGGIWPGRRRYRFQDLLSNWDNIINGAS
ncbi:hypothetical protein FRX31_021315 [Thalictrum thalictroides]|uniref:Reverse transcriptase zinc-binding domain-containing protein n=1 Tax=Thalictrum thalictroides TaxID=46969 RepID=A0A7J6VWW3_THATH|nr:hypothetical protein FRX31_021315 [Thalictrum thalictroides]